MENSTNQSTKLYFPKKIKSTKTIETASTVKVTADFGTNQVSPETEYVNKLKSLY